MRFTEHELTDALTGAAKDVLAAQNKDVRKGRLDIDTLWDGLDRFQRFQVLDGLGSEILPVLVALPDVEVVSGARATYTDHQVTETVESLVDPDLGRLKRVVAVKTRTALVQSALSHLPLRSDPDTLEVPDHL